MTKSTITDERITSVIERLEHYACNIKWTNVRGAQDLLAAADGLRELQKRRKADSEPVAEVVSIYGDPEAFGEREIRPLVGIQQMPYGTKLYLHAQPDASHLSRICAESYQVVGALAEALRIFNDVGVIKALDNLSAQEIIHDDVLPFSVPEAAQQPVVPAVSDDIGDIRVGRLPTINQDDYPGLGDWWVQLRIGEDFDEVLARVYGATPQEANNLAEALARRAAMLNGVKP